jgi:subtilisin family serine protease
LAAALVAAAAPAAGAPNDTLQHEQWAFSTDTVFDLPAAWNLSQGAGVVVAVVDSGIKLDHPDLAPNIWTNTAERPGNGIDDDANGYVDDVHGVDLTAPGANNRLHDGFGHGTHVAGTIAAAANGSGVVGVAYRAQLMTVKVLTDSGGGTTGTLAEGIRYAAANGARIINLSVETNTDDPALRAAVRAAEAADALIVASAGNTGTDIDHAPLYPVSIAAANVVGVAATATDGTTLPDFSNYGRLTVPVAAPGVDVLSTSKDGGFEVKSGTSMAAPHVAGVAALMAALAPNLPPGDLRALLLQNATRADAPVGSGYVDALGSVRGASTASSYELTQPPQLRVLSATRRGHILRTQIAVNGASQTVARVALKLGGHRAASLRGGTRTLIVRLRTRFTYKRLDIEARGANGHVLARASAPIRALRARSHPTGSGGNVGAVWAD